LERVEPQHAGRIGPERRARVAVLIPALDEEAALPLVLDELPRERLDVVLVVDNGSRDRTGAVAREHGAVVVREDRRGYGRACLTGLDALLGRRPDPVCAPLGADDVVVFLDGDHSDHPEELDLVAGPVLSGAADFVVGSRVLGATGRSPLLPQARFGNALACALMRLLFGARHTDLGPFRAIRVDALEHLRMRDVDYGWTVEMQLKARVAGLVVREVPVRYRERIGRSKITGTVSGSLRAGWKILGWIIGWRLQLLWPGRGIPRFRRSGSSARR
jgi:glycosyltransferase involved in cell wall biosynthesis